MSKADKCELTLVIADTRIVHSLSRKEGLRLAMAIVSTSRPSSFRDVVELRDEGPIIRWDAWHHTTHATRKEALCAAQEALSAPPTAEGESVWLWSYQAPLATWVAKGGRWGVDYGAGLPCDEARSLMAAP